MAGIVSLKEAASVKELLRGPDAIRAALAAEWSRLGVDSALAHKLSSHRVVIGDIARLQGALEEAEQPWAAEPGAMGSDFQLRRARAELARLDEEQRRQARPEWDQVIASDALDEVDFDDLRMRRNELRTFYMAANGLVPDVRRLIDRHSALTRRVVSLEGESVEKRYTSDMTSDMEGSDSRALRSTLLRRLADHLVAVSSGSGVGAPVFFDDAFLNVGHDEKIALLEALVVTSGRTQVVYMTEDRDVAEWAQLLAAAGAGTVVEGRTPVRAN